MVPRYVWPEAGRGSSKPMTFSVQASDVQKGVSRVQSMAGSAVRNLQSFQPVVPKLGKIPVRVPGLKMGRMVPGI